MNGRLAVLSEPRMRSLALSLFAATAALFCATTASAEIPESAGKLISAAREQVGVTKSYDPAYVVLEYPGGDVAKDRGVCTDVVIRAFRKLGLDLQKLVHEDMAKSFARYPPQWGLKRPDKNIDHRRVPNLMKYFERQGKSVPVSKKAEDYRPGDLVTCIVPPHLPHIMIVSDVPSPVDSSRMQIIHNIGQGAQVEDRLFDFEISGHYRYW
jgi:uncharacterized protein YijF (DUF1287 family)